MKHSLSVGSLSPKVLELVPRWLSAVQNRTTVLLLSREGGTVGGVSKPSSPKGSDLRHGPILSED